MTMTNTSTQKLSRHTTWLFAFGSIAAGLGASYALSGLGTKVTAAVYFAIVAIGGFLSTYLTDARVRGAVLAFFTGAGAAAVGYYMLVSKVMAAATSVATDVVSNGSAHAQGMKAAASMGHTFGIFIAVIVFLETIVAGIAGAVAGGKSRGQGGLAALASAARAAR
jgi:hypothetical protein